MNRRKMVIIGAGSASFTKTLVLSLAEDPRRTWELWLVDIDEEALAVANGLSAKIIAELGASVQLHATLDRCEALPGADYVVTTIGVGGRRAWEQDVFVPRKYGVFQPVGDTAMPGGISRAMRMVPAMIAITRDVQTLCPGAMFFNYSNPMSAICRAVRKATGADIVGLCHGVWHTEWELADFIGAPREACTTGYVGLNHLTYLYDFRREGRDAWPLVRDKLARIRAAGCDYHDTTRALPEMDEPLANPFCWSLFDDIGAYPAPGDRHVVEFYPERFPGGQYYGKVLGQEGAYSFEGTIAGGDARFAAMQKWSQGPEHLPEDAYGSHREKLVDMIDSLEDDGRLIFPVNLPNNGAVPGLPAEAVLEFPAAAGARGFQPLMQNGVPDLLKALINKQLATVEVIAEAALTGSANLFAEAVMMGGYMDDRRQVEKMVAEMMRAQGEYL